MCKLEDYFISYAIGGFWNYDAEGHWYEKEHTIVLDIPNREYLKMIKKYSKEKYSTGKPWFFFAYLPEKEDLEIISSIIGEKIDERVSDYIQRYYNYSDSFNKQITLYKNEDFGFYNKVLMDEEYRPKNSISIATPVDVHINDNNREDYLKAVSGEVDIDLRKADKLHLKMLRRFCESIMVPEYQYNKILENKYSFCKINYTYDLYTRNNYSLEFKNNSNNSIKLEKIFLNKISFNDLVELLEDESIENLNIISTSFESSLNIYKLLKEKKRVEHRGLDWFKETKDMKESEIFEYVSKYKYGTIGFAIGKRYDNIFSIDKGEYYIDDEDNEKYKQWEGINGTIYQYPKYIHDVTNLYII